MAKDLNITLLYDIYGDMLTEKQQEVLELYYNEDLSLAEIAEHTGITRQGVRDSIKRGEHQLGVYEEVLGLANRLQIIDHAVARMEKLIEILEQTNDSGYRPNRVTDIIREMNGSLTVIKESQL